uniref:SH3_10 domain-containing protein n=1 Tax=Macrostomum lignano TaxID=282301 RepID=A0A1I8G9Y0_9PLAT
MNSRQQVETQFLHWLEANHAIVHNPPLGSNRCSIEYERSRQRGIRDELVRIASGDLSRPAREQCSVAGRRVGDNIASLDFIAKIASLEDTFGSSAAAVTSEAHRLSTSGPPSEPSSGSLDSTVRKPLAGSAQRCWQWLDQLSVLLRLHSRNAADYNSFHVECHDAGGRMGRSFSHASRQLECLFHLHHPERTKRLLTTATDSLKHCLSEWAAVDHLVSAAHSIVPISSRCPTPVGKLSDKSAPLRGICACLYETPEFVVAQGQELTILDNSDRLQWRVRLLDGNEVTLPSITVWIPPRDVSSIDRAVRLKRQLSDQWTALIVKLKRDTVAHIAQLFTGLLDKQSVSLSII